MSGSTRGAEIQKAWPEGIEKVVEGQREYKLYLCWFLQPENTEFEKQNIK